MNKTTHLSNPLFRTIATIVGVFLVFIIPVIVTLPVAAQCNISDLSIQSGASCARGSSQPANLIGDGGIFKRITDILLFLVGAVAVVMLIIGGIRYVVSGGEQAQVTAAKNTILYAIIGIVVALLAYAAVNFVTTTLLSVSDTPSSTTDVVAPTTSEPAQAQ